MNHGRGTSMGNRQRPISTGNTTQLLSNENHFGQTNLLSTNCPVGTTFVSGRGQIPSTNGLARICHQHVESPTESVGRGRVCDKQREEQGEVESEDATNHTAFSGGWDGEAGPACSTECSEDPGVREYQRAFWFQDENKDPRPQSTHAEEGFSHDAIPMAEDCLPPVSGRTPLGKLPTNAMRYPFGHHIPHPLSTVSHTRV